MNAIGRNYFKRKAAAAVALCLAVAMASCSQTSRKKAASSAAAASSSASSQTQSSSVQTQSGASQVAATVSEAATPEQTTGTAATDGSTGASSWIQTKIAGIPEWIWGIFVNKSNAVKSGTYAYPSRVSQLTDYSPENPTDNPKFSESEIAEQVLRLSEQLDNIQSALLSSKKSYTIPAGNYRTQQYSLLSLKGFQRPADNPFVINGQGATIWIGTEAGHDCTRVYNCSNITFKGLTFDQDVHRNFAEGYVRAIDQTNNRLLFEPFKDQFDMDRLLSARKDAEAAGSSTNDYGGRLILFKHDGTSLTSYYNVGGNGPAGTEITDITEADKPNQVWIYMKYDKVTQATYSQEWKDCYGEQGTLEPNDLASLLFGQLTAVDIQYSGDIVFDSCNFYQGLVMDHDGEGHNQFLNCFFAPKPGTNSLEGSATLYGGFSRKGNIYENCIIGATADDQVNYDTGDGRAKTIGANFIDFYSGGGNTLPNLIAGEHVIPFQLSTGKAASTLVVDHTVGTTVYFTKDISGMHLDPSGYIFLFPEYQIENWRVESCVFLNGYQSFGFGGGPGIFRNNLIRSAGNTFQIQGNTNSTNTSPQWSWPHDIVIEDNVIVDSGNTPNHNGFCTWYSGGKQAAINNITLKNNIIMCSGQYLMSIQKVNGLIVENNILINPYAGLTAVSGGFGKQSIPAAGSRQAASLNTVLNAFFSGNVLFDKTNTTTVNNVSKSRIVGYSMSDRANIKLTDGKYYYDPANAIEARVRELIKAKHQMRPADIIKQIRKEFVK